MKKILTATLPALALLALGGCAPTGAISSTEDDGVYYSSADRTTVAPPAARPQADGYGYETARGQSQTTQTTEDANPDYQGDATQAAGTGTDYYDDSYASASPSGFGQPYNGPGVSTYNYTPSWSVSPSFYGSPFGYGAGLSLGYGYGGGFGGYGGGFGGYSPFGLGYGYPGYGGFYDPFFSPYGYGSAFSLGFGYGGFGGFGSPFGFGRPYGYGYSPYAYGGGYYGGADYYGGGYGGARRYVYKSDIVNGGYPNGYDRNAVRVGRRESRSMDAIGTPGMVNPGGVGAPAGAIGGRRIVNNASRGFVDAAGVAPGQVTGNDPNAPGGQPNGGRRFDQTTVNPNSPNAGGRGAWRSMDNNGANGGYNQPRNVDAAANPGGAQPRRGGFFRDVFGAPANGGNAAGANTAAGSDMGGARGGFSRPQQQRTYSQPDRSFSQPRMEQRTFSQPTPAPSFGGSREGGGFGGGASGGFGGGGGGGGGRRGR